MFIWDAPAVGPLKSILVYTPVEVTAIGKTDRLVLHLPAVLTTTVSKMLKVRCKLLQLAFYLLIIQIIARYWAM